MLTYADVFTDQGNPFYSGSIAEADATRVLNAALEPLYSELGTQFTGFTGTKVQILTPEADDATRVLNAALEPALLALHGTIGTRRRSRSHFTRVTRN